MVLFRCDVVNVAPSSWVRKPRSDDGERWDDWDASWWCVPSVRIALFTTYRRRSCESCQPADSTDAGMFDAVARMFGMRDARCDDAQCERKRPRALLSVSLHVQRAYCAKHTIILFTTMHHPPLSVQSTKANAMCTVQA